MTPIPTGTLTFLFTDIEGSTRLWQERGDAMPDALARHDALLQQAIAGNGGVVVKSTGDGVFAAFAAAPDALQAALDAQISLHAESWTRLLKDEGGRIKDERPEDSPENFILHPSAFILKIRVGLHTGLAEVRDGDYFGVAVNRAARLMSAAHGGQILLSLATRELCQDALPPDVALRDLSEHRLKDLARPERVFQVVHPDLPADFPPLRSLDNPELPNNLPRQLTSFVGREKEIAEATALLAKTRLLTLTGPGGNGKTRLSLQIAANVLDDYPDGAWFVELAPLTDPALVPEAVAAALDLREQPGKSLTQTLTESLREKRLLVVLDNCEHLIAACAELADALLRACPNIRLLASSREPLNIAGELNYRVPSLSLPETSADATPESLTQYEAVRLFIERAMFHKPDFAVTNQNAPALASLCVRLDGVPLAIELAAARVRSLTVPEIHDRLNDRFRLLTGGGRAVLPRQQTLRAAMDWSYDLLTDAEKTLLPRLSVFAGGWTLEAAEQVAGRRSQVAVRESVPPLRPATCDLRPEDILDLLTSLADKSLVLAEMAGDQTRYRLLETMRQYGRERLPEGDATRERHRAYFLAFAEEAHSHLTGAEQSLWLERMAAEHENLRAALDGKQDETTLRLAATLARFWAIRAHYREGRERLTLALASAENAAPTPLRARALNSAGVLARLQGDYNAAARLGEESLSIYQSSDDKQGAATALNDLGAVAYFQGDSETAKTRFIESLALSREAGDTNGAAVALNRLGVITVLLGDYAAARSYLEQALEVQREMKNKEGISSVLVNLGVIVQNQGDYEAARAMQNEAREIALELGDRHTVGSTLTNLGTMAVEQGDYAAAQPLLEESAAINRELGDKSGEAMALANLGGALLGLTDYAAAQAVLGDALKIVQETGEKNVHVGVLAHLSELAACLGDSAQALSLQRESLTMAHELGDLTHLTIGIERIARFRSQAGETLLAARLWGAAEVLRETLGAPLYPSVRAEYARALADARAALGDEPFDAAWQEGKSLTTEEAVALALSP